MKPIRKYLGHYLVLILLFPGANLAASQRVDRIVERFDKSPLFITILYIVIVYSIVAMIILLVVIMLNRRRMQREEQWKVYLKEQYQQKIMDYLFEIEKRDQTLKELARIANSKFSRQLLINEMIDLSINLKGEIKESIRELYLLLDLKKDSLAKAYSKKWHENVRGFRDLAFMDIREANERIMASLNSNNEILRMEAQIALVGLSEDNPYQFLDFLEKPLSIWEQITLHELLIQQDLKIPLFRQWFESKNHTVVIFALEMVSSFRQKGTGSELIKLFNHENQDVRQTAYRVSGELGLRSSLPAMKRNYIQEPVKNKLEILNAFCKIPVERHLNFLKSVLDQEEDVQLQIKAVKAMESTGEAGISRLIQLMKSKSEYRNYQIIIRHVLDGRIY